MNTTAFKAQDTYLTRLYGTERSRILKKGLRIITPQLVIAKEISRNESLRFIPKVEMSLQNNDTYSEWNMPDSGSGYIKAKNNDCW